jgi:hypothetical protein
VQPTQDTPALELSETELEMRLLELMQQCKAVICCRVSPLQVRTQWRHAAALHALLRALRLTLPCCPLPVGRKHKSFDLSRVALVRRP